MDYIIRKMKAFEYPFLKDFLYEAIFQRDETNLLPKTIINEPALKVYIEDFGKKKDDYCLCAEVDKKIVGAVWIRNIVGYGNIDDETPEFSISLFKEFRGYGIGTDLMKEMIKYLRNNGYKKASLAVQKDNYALKMYISVGFQVINENIEEYIMVNYLS
ncbi:acetyltransferase [Clostridium carboxidivorans P7]|uniref:GCN5-related N-acetyltransferase n=1 Tax=Clostridium carboxidivorans P7 TaxID=536227 RepID=C6PNU9_9CLOT|nr:GNAT family N-acetyltransferase [Clostridium carboxidivorans]AKN31293.1 acetyltransferase [Clostridium carboxidivorans P7]EET89027.1 GCN5-related N-acetyltransferase [Clostridium carboxidivorans P7]EFG88421.1 acetyltransferase, GNAT family [Clostridium carboxidivorans P7]